MRKNVLISLVLAFATVFSFTFVSYTIGTAGSTSPTCACCIGPDGYKGVYTIVQGELSCNCSGACGAFGQYLWNPYGCELNCGNIN